MSTNPLPISVISAQPGASELPGQLEPDVQSIPSPRTVSGCAPGLEYLTRTDKLFVNQRVNIMEAFTGWKVKNKYAIVNRNGDPVYFAYEESDGLKKRSNRGYTIHIVDNRNQDVIKLVRTYNCCTCSWFACATACGSETTIEAPPGNVLGIVSQRSGFCSNNFVVTDQRDGTDVLRIESPSKCSIDCSCGETEKIFEISKIDNGEVIGSVRKKTGGQAEESFTNADLFSVEFPLDLDVSMKAMLIGAMFLIDIDEFEDESEKKKGKKKIPETGCTDVLIVCGYCCACLRICA